MVIITGNGFGQNMAVSVCGEECLNLQYVSSTELTCTTPAHSGRLDSFWVYLYMCIEMRQMISLLHNVFAEFSNFMSTCFNS